MLVAVRLECEVLHLLVLGFIRFLLLFDFVHMCQHYVLDIVFSAFLSQC
jgi:hypothetical protein